MPDTPASNGGIDRGMSNREFFANETRATIFTFSYLVCFAEWGGWDGHWCLGGGFKALDGTACGGCVFFIADTRAGIGYHYLFVQHFLGRPFPFSLCYSSIRFDYLPFPLRPV